MLCTGVGRRCNPGVLFVVSVLGRTHHSGQLQQVQQRLCQVSLYAGYSSDLWAQRMHERKRYILD